MSNRIRYAYLKEHTWLYRRNYPTDVALILGVKALKQSLKTSDAKVARTRAGEVNSLFEARVEQARTGLERQAAAPAWQAQPNEALAHLRAALEASDGVVFPSKSKKTVPSVSDLSRAYLRHRGGELRPGGYKSVRYSVELFSSKFPDHPIDTLGRCASPFELVRPYS